MPHKINPDRWVTNYECLNVWDYHTPDGKPATGGLDLLIQKYNRYEVSMLKHNFWFIAGFPEVFLWLQYNMDAVNEEMEDEGGMEQWEEPDGSLKIECWNKVIEIYKKKTHNYRLRMSEGNF